MGGLRHFEVSSAWGIPSPSYIKSTGLHTTIVQTLLMEGQSPHPMLTTRQQMVLPPHEWPGFIQKVHSKLGHFGIKHTYSLFALHYHWKGMHVQV